MKNYKIIGGYYVSRNTKEEILNTLINVMSSKAMVVDYKFLKSLSKEELIKRLENINNFNVIVTEYDINGNYTVNTGIKNGNSLNYAGKSIYFETKEEYIKNMNEVFYEGNKITDVEKSLYNRIKKEMEA